MFYFYFLFNFGFILLNIKHIKFKRNIYNYIIIKKYNKKKKKSIKTLFQKIKNKSKIKLKNKKEYFQQPIKKKKSKIKKCQNPYYIKQN